MVDFHFLLHFEMYWIYELQNRWATRLCLRGKQAGVGYVATFLPALDVSASNGQLLTQTGIHKT
ncbi:MAG: hypothetical protein COC23_04745 [Hyphomicrobiales bacterium]|nr:MAG: hypothetical protein COC23_04745 [Hyphomicrobiales bacterium]